MVYGHKKLHFPYTAIIISIIVLHIQQIAKQVIYKLQPTIAFSIFLSNTYFKNLLAENNS